MSLIETKRTTAIKVADALNSIEGVPVSAFAKELSAKWANGDIEFKDKTDSLISIKENVKDISIPLEERKIKMYPMNFEDFCCALVKWKCNGRIYKEVLGKYALLPKDKLRFWFTIY